MRIGIVTGEYPPMQGGVGAYTAILARHLSATEDVRIFSTEAAHSADIPLTNTLRSWGYGSLRAVADWAQTNQLDVLNLQFQTAAFNMSPWVHFLPDVVHQVPVVTTFHDLRYPYLFPKAGPLRDWIVHHLAGASTGVIVTNHEDAIQVNYLPRHQLIPIGSNITNALPADYQPGEWRTRAGATESDFLLGYFGLINRSKGLDTLLNSLAQLRTNGVPARLLIIGGTTGSNDPTNAAYLKEIEQAINTLKLNDYIHRTGYIEDEMTVGSYLSACDAVVLPFTDGASFRRGSLMAAIHYGCPVVTTTPYVPIPEFVPGENMMFVPASDPEALTRALIDLHANPTLRARLHTGAASLAQHFDWQAISDAYIAFFHRVLEASA